MKIKNKDNIKLKAQIYANDFFAEYRKFKFIIRNNFGKEVEKEFIKLINKNSKLLK